MHSFTSMALEVFHLIRSCTRFLTIFLDFKKMYGLWDRSSFYFHGFGPTIRNILHFKVQIKHPFADKDEGVIGTVSMDTRTEWYYFHTFGTRYKTIFVP